MMFADSFLQRLYRRQSRRFFLTFDLPAAYRAFDLPDGFFRFYSSDDGDHHPARAKMFAMEFHQIIALDLLDCFRESIFRTTVRMTFKENIIEDHRSHIPCIFRANVEPGQ